MVTSIDGKPISGLADLVVLTGGTNEHHAVVVVRARKPLDVAWPGAPGGGFAGARPDAGLTIASAAPGVELATVEPGSRAYRAGLRGGDRLLKLNNSSRLNAASLHRTLTASDRPVYIVYQRGDRIRGAWLPNE